MVLVLHSHTWHRTPTEDWKKTRFLNNFFRFLGFQVSTYKLDTKLRPISTLLLSCAKSHMLSASRRQSHLLHVSTVDRCQIWSVDRSWRWVTLSGFLQSHNSLLMKPRFLWQALQWPWPVRKRFSSDHWRLWRSKPGSRIVGSTTKVELTKTIASLPSTDLWHQLSAIPSTVVCAIPDEVEEGERRHHIMANHGNVELVSQQWAHQTEVEDVTYLMQCLTDVWAGVEQSIIDHSIDQWHMRLPVCIRAAGEHFKYSLLHKSVKTFKLSLIFFSCSKQDTSFW